MKLSELRLIIVTGISGAGKTQTVRCLEDLGFFCIDNLPPSLIPQLLDEVRIAKRGIKSIALVIDVRGGKFFEGLDKTLEYFDKEGLNYKILFLDASDEVLIRRFKETRRDHPLAYSQGIMEGIIKERKILESLKARAGYVLDTSEMSTSQLKEQLVNIFGKEDGILPVAMISFGYKYGVPMDADLLIDVRFIPNPYYDLELRSLSGHDQQIKEFVLGKQITEDFLAMYSNLLRFLIPLYIKEGKSHLVIAVGCTGGRHRSVVLAEKLAASVKDMGCRVVIKHRDIER